MILHDRRGTGLSSRNVDLPNLETRVSDILTVMDAVRFGAAVIVGILESGAPGALLAATKPERVAFPHLVRTRPRFAWAPDYPWGAHAGGHGGRAPRYCLWGTLAYGRRVADEAARGEARRRNGPSIWRKRAGTRARPMSRGSSRRIWYETDVRGVFPSSRCPDVDPDMARPRGLQRTQYVGRR